MKCKRCGSELLDGQEYCEICGEPVKKRKAWKLSLLLVLIVVLAAGAVGGAYYFIGRNAETKVKALLDDGAKYYASADYATAIVKYQAAIKAAPEMEEGYEGLAQVYIAQGDYGSAKDTLLDGISFTNGKKLITLLGDVLNNGKAAEAVENADSEQLRNLSRTVELQENVFTVVASNTYGDYIQVYGSPQIAADAEGRLHLGFSNFPGQCIFYDVPDDSYIVNESSGQPYENKKPNAVTFTNLGNLFFNFQGAVSAERLGQLFGGIPAIAWNQEAERYEITVTYKKCALTIETDKDGNIVSPSAWNELRPLSAGAVEEKEEEKTASQSGRIINAVTGGGVRATLNVRAERQKTGTILASVVSGSNGLYQLDLAPGRYMLEVTASGFISDYFEITVKENGALTNENYTISPELNEGEIRIVLEWKANPQDLDSYLEGTMADGTRVGINYRNRSQRDRNGNEIASLDVDDTNGYGPETITITNLSGDFRYFVQDFRNEGVLGEYGATVKVYMPEESSPTVIQAPSDVINTWDVLRIENGELRIVNRAAD